MNLNFEKEIEEIVQAGNSYLDAIIHYCQSKNLEIESVTDVIKKNQRLQSLLRIDAEDLNYLPKTARLDI